MRSIFNTLITILVCFSLFFTMFTPIKAFVKGGQTLSFLMPVIFIFVVDALFLRRHTYWAFLAVSIITMLHFMGVEYFENYLSECLYLLFGVFALEHYLITRDKSFAKWVLITEFATLLFLIVLSIPQFILEPNLTRMLNSAAEDPTIEFNYYWCISYRTVHELPVLSITVFALYYNAQNKAIKVLSLVCLALMFIVMIFASSASSLLIMVTIYIIMLLYSRRRSIGHNVIRLVVVTLLVLPFMSKTATVGIIDNYILPVFEGSSTSQRIEEIRYYILTGNTDGDMNSREDRYNVTSHSIMNNPLLPEFEDSNIGHHSHMLDHLAAMGLIFFIPYILFIFVCIKRPAEYITNEKYFFIVAALFYLLLATLKNFFIFTPAMFIVPLSLIHIEKTIGYELHPE